MDESAIRLLSDLRYSLTGHRPKPLDKTTWEVLLSSATG